MFSADRRADGRRARMGEIRQYRGMEYHRKVNLYVYLGHGGRGYTAGHSLFSVFCSKIRDIYRDLSIFFK